MSEGIEVTNSQMTSYNYPDKKVFHHKINGYWTSPCTVSESDWDHILIGVSDNVKTMLYCYLKQPGYLGDDPVLKDFDMAK